MPTEQEIAQNWDDLGAYITFFVITAPFLFLLMVAAVMLIKL